MAQAATNANQSSQQVVQNWAKFYNIPAWIPLSIANVESAYNPNAQGDFNAQKQPTSFGLFQLHIGGGQGDGFSPAQLYDPNLNSQVAIAHMVGPYQQAVQQNLTGYDLLSYVASHSGHPNETGVLPSSYNTQLQQSYQQVTGNQPSSTSGSSGTSGSAPSYPAPSGIMGTILRVFWVLVGVAIVILGIWLMFNPFASLTTTIAKVAKEFAKMPLEGLNRGIGQLPDRARGIPDVSGLKPPTRQDKKPPTIHRKNIDVNDTF